MSSLDTARTRRQARTRCLGVALALLAGTVRAHHGSAAYDVTREITVEGAVVEFQWINPHVRVVVNVARAGTIERWDCEGPPRSWAESRGWTGATLRAGETVRLVMYPPRRGSGTGLIKRIERENGDVLPVSRPWLDNG